MKNQQNSSPNQNLKQQSILNFFKKPENNMSNKSIQDNDFNQIQKDEQQDKQTLVAQFDNLDQFRFENKKQNRSLGQGSNVQENFGQQEQDDIKVNTNRTQVDTANQNQQKPSKVNDILDKYRMKDQSFNEKDKQIGQVEDPLNKYRTKNQPSKEKQEQTSQILNTQNQSNISFNSPSQNIIKPTENFETLELFHQNSRKQLINESLDNEIDEEDQQDDNDDQDDKDNKDDKYDKEDKDDKDDRDEKDESSSDESNNKKKQKTNDGEGISRPSQLNDMYQQYYTKLNQNFNKQQKLKKKEEDKKARAKQELIEQARLEQEKKREQESKLQRQKLAQYKKMQELKKEKLKQELQSKISIKEQIKSLNFEETFAKTQDLQSKKLLLTLNDVNKTQTDDNKIYASPNKPLDEQNKNEQTGNQVEMTAYDKNLDYLFDETENEEEKKNYSSLLKFIFSQNYNKEDIVRVGNKRIPNRFSSWKEYFTIFEFLFLMECVSNIQQQFLSFKQNENYRSPFNTFIKLITTKENAQGFFEFQVYRDGLEKNDKKTKRDTEAGELDSSEDDYYSLSTLKNHAVLITNEPNLDLSVLSSTNFRKKTSFLFFGWVVPPENANTGVLKLFADIDVDSFRRQFQAYDEKISVKVYNFTKMTTYIRFMIIIQIIREYLSIKNMRYNDLNRFIYNPSHIVETSTPINNPCNLFIQSKIKYTKL